MKFTIRDLFLATMTVAVALGWWRDHEWHVTELKYQHIRLQLHEANTPLYQLPAPNPPTP